MLSSPENLSQSWRCLLRVSADDEVSIPDNEQNNHNSRYFWGHFWIFWIGVQSTRSRGQTGLAREFHQGRDMKVTRDVLFVCSMDSVIYNPNPTVFLSSQPTRSSSKIPLWMEEDDDETVNFEDDSNDVEPIDQNEIFGEQDGSSSLPFPHRDATDLVRSINDPEHPNTLEQLRVVSAPQITIKGNLVTVEFTPTVPHCGMSTLIGMQRTLCLALSL